ncbi:serine/threonine-protein kinase [Burkholderia plantarii]|uniref:PpkA/Stk: serine/threonine protein kinase PpkA/Stk n=1 Tax=Burkholderia plantarii TaxID=41899 RepID=A0A0B6S1Z8_BURPL|nr:serine/threonine-protein kinase [Burkholderia plantarii]AJK48394.1 ppkA/Stk: serine/threonine protein kinase PpkA/Stk [Burkholderia plantarii]
MNDPHALPNAGRLRWRRLLAGVGRRLADRLARGSARRPSRGPQPARRDPPSPAAATTNRTAHAATAHGDLTLVQVGRPGVNDATARPAAHTASADDDATVVVRPLARIGGGGTRSDSLSRESWRRIASAQGGDHATVGTLLKGRFLLERELGRGGMGVVYLARDERKVEARDRDPYLAVKVLNDEFRRHPDSLIALQREARRAQKLADDHIVHVYDFDKDGTIVFMTMEYIDGIDLRTLIRERPSGMPLREAWPLIDGMARALQRAHASGIVHSDFKPGNVMVTRDGVPKVFDFGIARAGNARAGAAGEQTVFDAGTLGALTPAYASLEMIQGADPAVRDDVYALGCVIFELLTGHHPFERHSAEVALASGALPPAVPGLPRRQYRALCEAVAFRGEHRLQTIGALVEGLRPRRRGERLAPYFAGLLVAAVVVAGGFALHGHHRQRELDLAIARFADGDAHRYANEVQAQAALDALGSDARERLVLARSDVILHFLSQRLDAYWSPPLGRFDYAAVQRVFAMRERLKLFSPAFDARRQQIEDERTDMLARLGGALDEAVDRDALFEDLPGSAADVLQRIRLLDPGSALLRGTRLELKYDAAIGQSIDLGKYDEARARIALGLQLFPESARLRRRRDQLAAEIASAAARPARPASAMSAADARRALTGLAASPSTSKPWLDGVASAMAALQGDDAPETGKAVETLADGIVAAAAQVGDPGLAHQYLDLVEVGLRYAPHSPGLAEQRDRMLMLLQQQRIDQQIASDDPAAQVEALRLAASAGDGPRALAALNRLRALQPGSAVLTGAGPQFVATAYLGDARALARRGKLAEAASLVSQGADAVQGDARLGAAAQRYLVAAAILAARGRPIADPDFQDLRARYSAAQSADPAGMQQLERDLGASTPLPPGGLGAVLDQLRATAGGASGADAGNGADGSDGTDGTAGGEPRVVGSGG